MPGNITQSRSAALLVVPLSPRPDLLQDRWNAELRIMLYDLDDFYRHQIETQVTDNIGSFWESFDDLAPSTAKARIKENFEYLHRYNLAVHDDFDRWPFWGSLLIATRAAIETEKEKWLLWFERSLQTLLSPLKGFLDVFNISEKTTKRSRTEMAIEVHLSITKFSIAVIKQFSRGPPDSKMTGADWAALDGECVSALQVIKQAIPSVMNYIGQVDEHAEKDGLSIRQSALALHSAKDSDEAVLPCNTLPHAVDNRFYDRRDIFKEMDKRLKRFEPSRTFCAVALHGLGGIGKSEIAIQYAHSRSDHYEAILWVLSETENDLENSFTSICRTLELKGLDEKNHAVNKIILKTWLRDTSTNWLMIFDNASNSDLVWPYWPVATRGAVIVTTRDRKVSFNLSISNEPISVEAFDKTFGSNMLLSVLRKQGTAEELEAAEALSTSTGGLPLALFNLAGLIESMELTVPALLEMYKQDMSEWHTHTQGHPNQRIDTVWRPSFDHLESHSAALLAILSLFAPDAVPLDIFKLKKAKNVKVPSYLQFMKNEHKFQVALGTLTRHHLVKRSSDRSHVSVHRLVQFEYIRYIDPSVLQEAFDAAAMLMDHAFPQQDTEDVLQARWSLCAAYSPHVLSLMRLYKQSRRGESGNEDESDPARPIPELRSSIHLLRAMTRCAWHFQESFHYEPSLVILRICLDAWDAFDGKEDHPKIFTHICNHIGVANYWIGNFDESARFYGPVFEIDQRTFEEAQFERGNTLFNLASLNLSLGEPEVALEYNLKAMNNFKIGQSAETEKTDQASSSISRAKCYIDLGRLKEAREVIEFSVDRLTELGYTLSLAHAFRLLGDIELAEKNIARAKENYEKSKDLLLSDTGLKTHQMLGAAYIRLGSLAQREEDYESAVSWFEDALDLADFNAACEGYRARSLYMLAHAQKLHTGLTEEMALHAENNMRDARELLQRILGDKYREELSNDQDAYDKLVLVHVR